MCFFINFAIFSIMNLLRLTYDWLLNDVDVISRKLTKIIDIDKYFNINIFSLSIIGTITHLHLHNIANPTIVKNSMYPQYCKCTPV